MKLLAASVAVLVTTALAALAFSGNGELGYEIDRAAMLEFLAERGVVLGPPDALDEVDYAQAPVHDLTNEQLDDVELAHERARAIWEDTVLDDDSNAFDESDASDLRVMEALPMASFACSPGDYYEPVVDVAFERLLASQQCNHFEATDAEWRCGMLGKSLSGCPQPQRTHMSIGERGYCGNEGRSDRPLVPEPLLGQPRIEGDFRKLIVRRYIRRNLHRIASCYESELRVIPGIGGEVTVQFFITAAGAVLHSTGRGFDRNVARCVAAVIRAIEFPRPNSAVMVIYPFTFRPTAGN